MAVQISWNGFTWGYNDGKIISVDELSTSRSVDVERNEDKEGEPATQTVALALASLSFSYVVSTSAGGSPLKEFTEMNECPGVHAPLYLNGARFIANEVMLKSCDSSDWILDGSGRAVSVKISLKFEEYAEDASGLKMSKVEKNSQLRPGVQTDASATSALSVGASSSQKAAMASSNPQMQGW